MLGLLLVDMTIKNFINLLLYVLLFLDHRLHNSFLCLYNRHIFNKLDIICLSFNIVVQLFFTSNDHSFILNNCLVASDRFRFWHAGPKVALSPFGLIDRILSDNDWSWRYFDGFYGRVWVCLFDLLNLLLRISMIKLTPDGGGCEKL